MILMGIDQGDMDNHSTREIDHIMGEIEQLHQELKSQGSPAGRLQTPAAESVGDPRLAREFQQVIQSHLGIQSGDAPVVLQSGTQVRPDVQESFATLEGETTPVPFPNGVRNELNAETKTGASAAVERQSTFQPSKDEWMQETLNALSSARELSLSKTTHPDSVVSSPPTTIAPETVQPAESVSPMKKHAGPAKLEFWVQGEMEVQIHHPLTQTLLKLRFVDQGVEITTDAGVQLCLDWANRLQPAA